MKHHVAQEARRAIQRVERNMAVLAQIGDAHRDELSPELFEAHETADAAIEKLHEVMEAEAQRIGVRSGGDPKPEPPP